MPTSTDVVAEARGLIEKRLSGLDDERKRLERALAELSPNSARKPGRPRKAPSTPKRRRRRNGNTRADQAVKLITAKPGISTPDIAKSMKIKPNYLYRVLGDLEKEGRVKKDGRTYNPA